MDYGQIFANSFDLAQAHESLLEHFNIDLPEFAPLDAPNPVETVEWSGREATLLKEIRQVETSIRTRSLRSDSPEEILPLELKKTRLWLDLRRAGAVLRDMELVALELEEATIQLKILKSTTTEESREENDEYIELLSRKRTLTKELEALEAAEPPTEPSSEPQTETNPGTLVPASSQKPNPPPETSATVRPAPVAEEDPAHKRQKRTADQIENRQNVLAAGGQCLNCKSNRQKSACTGGEKCLPCHTEGLECIRPGLIDKNAFKLWVALPQDTPTSAAGSMYHFFDMRGHTVIRQSDPLILEALDGAYSAIIDHGFDADIGNSRKKALRGFCAFNIFVKANTVVNNWHLPFVGMSLEDSFRPSIEFDEFLERITWKSEPSAKEIQERIASKLDTSKVALRKEFELLRAVSSEYVLLLLEQFLKDIHIRECKGYNKLDRKASLLAAVGLTLEQVIDFSDSIMRSKVKSPELVGMLRQLALVLLSYLQPPSPLAFPEPSPVNQCFRRTSSPLGVDMDDAFWYELYKASSAAIPAHLLQVVPVQESKSPPPASPKPGKKPRSNRDPPLHKFRKDNDQRVQGIARSFLGMNLRLNKHPSRSDTRAAATLDSHLPHPYHMGPVPYDSSPSVSDIYDASSTGSDIYASTPSPSFDPTPTHSGPYFPTQSFRPPYNTGEDPWSLYRFDLPQPSVDRSGLVASAPLASTTMDNGSEGRKLQRRR